MTTSVIETPSGKTAHDENFPVGSWLLPAALRPHVALFYAFARAIDDIADNPELSAAEKTARLDGFEAAITGRVTDRPGFEKAYRLRQSLLETGVNPAHCVDLISAFKQDAVKPRYRDWDELMDYCMRSAAPVGRYLLDLHGESRDGYPASDALCNALQIINHLQDCKDDYMTLGRVYLPLDWVDGAGGAVSDLDGAQAGPALRRVFDQALDGVDRLLADARELPGRLRSRRLAMESAVIFSIAERLVRKLRRRDPVAERVELGPASVLLCGVQGLWRAMV